jgi:hypothetical protein
MSEAKQMTIESIYVKWGKEWTDCGQYELDKNAFYYDLQSLIQQEARRLKPEVSKIVANALTDDYSRAKRYGAYDYEKMLDKNIDNYKIGAE